MAALFWLGLGDATANFLVAFSQLNQRIVFELDERFRLPDSFSHCNRLHLRYHYRRKVAKPTVGCQLATPTATCPMPEKSASA